MKMIKILIIEDDEKIAHVLKEYLQNSNYQVLVLYRGNKVVKSIQTNPPDLVLLDIMLPDEDGMKLCREIRLFSKVPIIMITARTRLSDRLLGLELGADDYICKPFIPKEVVARVKAVLRRTYQAEEKKNKLVVGPIAMDEEKHRVTVRRSEIHLTPIEYQLLRIMMCSPNRVFTRNDFISKIQGYNYDGYERTIDNHIKNLRKKINDICLQNQERIHTIYGIGYKLSA